MVETTSSDHNKNKKNKILQDDDESMNEVFEACIFNCTYIPLEQQLVDEQEDNMLNQKKKSNEINNKKWLDVVVTDSILEDDVVSMDERSLLDVHSSDS